MSVPCRVLLERLIAARECGEGFESAWPAVLIEAVRTADRREREEWVQALAATADSWRAAFERRPATRPELALALVAAEDRGVLLPERPCQLCDAPIPDERGGAARYCSDGCRRKASAERLVAA